MWFQRLTDYLLHHRWQAMVLTFLITYIPVLGMTSIIIAGLMTLCVGAFEGALFTIAASLPYAFVFAAKMPESPSIVIWATVILSVLGNVLTWVFAVMLRKHCNWSVILQVAALIGVLVISLLHLGYPNIADWWVDQLTAFYNQSAQLAGLAKAGQVEPLGEAQLETINTIKNYATGLMVGFVLLTSILQVMVARWWQLAMAKRSQIGKELQRIHLSHLAGGLFILSIIFYYLENSVVLDILPVLCLLFGAAGLSLVHYLCGLMGPVKGRFWLSVLYVAMMYSLIMMAMLPLFSALSMTFPVVLGVLVLAVCVFMFVTMGLLDVWLDVRKRIQRV